MTDPCRYTAHIIGWQMQDFADHLHQGHGATPEEAIADGYRKAHLADDRSDNFLVYGPFKHPVEEA